MEERIYLGELAANLEISNKTLLEWLAALKIEPITDKYDRRKRYISIVDAQKLASEHERILRDMPRFPVTIRGCHAMIAKLTKEIEDLKAQLADTEIRRPPVARKTHTTQRQNYVSGQYHKDEYGDNHDKETGLLTGNATAHIVAVHMRISEQSAKRHNLDAIDMNERRNRHTVINWLRVNGYFRHECELETCPCHATEETT